MTHTPKILIDGLPLFSGHKNRGIGIFSKNLIENISASNNLFDIKILVPSTYADEYFLNLRVERIFIWPKSKNLYLITNQLVIPLILIMKRYDLFHSFEPTSIIYSKTKRIMMVYDTIKSVMSNEYKQGPIGKILGKLLDISLKYSDHIITISENSKKDILKYYNIEHDKISVVYGAVGPEFHIKKNTEEEIRSLKIKYEINGKYVIYVGNYVSPDKRKNVPLLLNIVEKYNNEHNDLLLLVLVGKVGPYSTKLRKDILERNITSFVRFTDFINDQDLSLLLSSAECLVFPSLYEGLGLPLIEAMACGLPIIAFANSSIIEVVGDSGLLVKNKDEDIFYDMLTTLLQNDTLKEELHNRGLKKAAQYSWSNSTNNVLDIYGKILSTNA